MSDAYQAKWCESEDEENADALREVHVYPEYGQEHVLAKTCWCGPGRETHCQGVIFVHHVMH